MREPNFDALRLAAIDRRVELGINVDDLVDRAEISRSQINRMLHGHREGSITHWFKLAQALELSPSALFRHLEDK
nr:helix-turn-helix transcriptional regulator [Leifsonia sp. Leaf325]